MSDGNVSAPQPAADGSEMDAGNVPARQPAEPSAGKKRKRLPENADGQSDDIIADDDDDDDDDHESDDESYDVDDDADMRLLRTVIRRRFRLQRKNVGMIRRSIADMRSGITELQNKLDSNRNFLLGALQTSYQKCQERLETETAKMDKLFEELVKCKAAHEQAVKGKMDKLFEELPKCKAAHEQAVKDTLCELKEGRDLLLKQHEESRKNDENIASSFIGEIDKLLKALNKRDKDDNRAVKVAMMCGGFVKKLPV